MLFLPGDIAVVTMTTRVYQALPGTEHYWQRALTLEKNDIVTVTSTGNFYSQPCVLVITSHGYVGWVLTGKLNKIDVDNVVELET